MSRCVHIFLSKLSVFSFVLFLFWFLGRVALSEYFFFSKRAAWGGALPDFVFLFSFPCSADHERNWPPCKVFFSGWQIHHHHYRQRHLLRTAYFARGWRLIDRPKPSTCSYLPCSYLTIRLPPRCSGCLFLFQYSMSTCPIMLCSTVCCAVQQ